MHVLVVEDDARIRKVLADGFLALGCRVTSLRDGDSVFTTLESNPDIELAVMNWMLPGRGGLALSRGIKAASDNVRTIIMVGGRFCSEIREAFRSWADDFVSKSQFVSVMEDMLVRESPAARRTRKLARGIPQGYQRDKTIRGGGIPMGRPYAPMQCFCSR